MQRLKPLAKQVMVITGASSGIGRETALQAAGRGARVVLTARDGGALAALEAEIRRNGGQALAAPADVTVAAEVDAVAERAVATFGGIDTWINGAGVSAYGRFEQMAPEEFRRVMEVNFLGQVHGCQAALPHLRATGNGALICIGSALSDRAVPLQSGYCASKHAVKALTEALRVELRHEGSAIQVTLIKPSSFNTPLFAQAVTHLGVMPRPMTPVYDPAIAAQAILYAAEHRVRDLCIGGGAKLFTSLEATAGPLLDWWLARTAVEGQKTNRPKSATAPNNLCRPIPGMGHVRDDHGGRRFSLYTSARLHPRQTVAAGATLLGLAVLKLARR